MKVEIDTEKVAGWFKFDRHDPTSYAKYYVIGVVLTALVTMYQFDAKGCHEAVDETYASYSHREKFYKYCTVDFYMEATMAGIFWPVYVPARLLYELKFR